MVYVGSLLSGTGLVHRFLSGLVGTYYLWSNPRMWFYQFIKYIPAWFGPGNENSPAVEMFYTGSEGGVPWDRWLIPLALWSVLISAIFFTMLCVVNLLRRQWIEKENLNFPIAQLPIEIIDAEGRFGRIGGFFQHRLTWVGFAVSAILFGYNGLTNYLTVFQPVSLDLNLSNFLVEKPWSAVCPPVSPFIFSVSPLIIGISYLLPLEVSFGVWFFFLLGRVQLLLSEIFGLSNITPVSPATLWAEWSDQLFPFLRSQARGGLYALAFFTLWTARFHIKELLTKVFRGKKSKGVDDSREGLSYRFSFWGVIGGLVVSVIWTSIAGLSIWYGITFFCLFLVFALVFARMRAEAGVPFIYTLPSVAILIYIVLGAGPRLYGASDYVVLSHLNMFCRGGFAMLMVIVFESYKMGHMTYVPPRRMTVALLLSFAIGLVVAYWTSLTTIYSQGMATLESNSGYAGGSAFTGHYVHHILVGATNRGSAPVGWLSLIFQGVGFAVTVFLAVMRRAFSQWPLHPIGYVIGTGFGSTLWGSVLLGWGIKTLVLNYGGVQLYKMAFPAFLGLALGHLTMNVFWAVVALLVGSAGG